MSSNRLFFNPLFTSAIAQPGSQDTTSIDLGIDRSQSIVLSAEQVQGVRPGDVITSDLFNRLHARLAALEASNPTGILLGPLGANTHTLVALGTGFETGGGIFLDGVSLLSSPPQGGINLVILDPNLSRKFSSAYDTSKEKAAESESARLAKDLQDRAAAHDLVLVATHEIYSFQLSADARQALAAVGGAAMAVSSPLKNSAAFIGIVPDKRVTVRYNYLVSIIPADVGNSVAALPFVWGIYSIPLKRFLIGGGSSSQFLPPPGVSGPLPPPTFAGPTTASAEGPAIDRANEPTEPEPSENPPPRRKQPAARRRRKSE